MHSPLRVALASVTVVLAGCGGTSTPSGATDAGYPPVDVANPRCVPDRAQWMSTVQAQVTTQCGNCHGSTPNYGAPFSLVDYDANVAGPVGTRRVDHMVARLMAGTMPPAGTPAPTDDVAQSIVSWASCGASTAPTGTGVRASAALFQSPASAPSGMPSFELRADNFAVTSALTEKYQCYTFDVPVTEARFIRRFEIALDHSAVVHHIVLLRDTMHTAPTTPFECSSMPDGSQFLYAWAPGQTPFQFPDGGLRAAPGDRFVLQIHYNNSAGMNSITDRSGVRLYHDVPQGTEYGMIGLGPTQFSIPAHGTGSAESACTLNTGSRLLAAMPHMHGIGTGFSEHILHANGTTDPVITLQGWRFDTQLFYNTPAVFSAGDRIVTHCDYNNTRDTVVHQGAHTTDEMCFDFAYVTPPPTQRFCDEMLTPAATMYVPGTCAEPAAPTDPTPVMGTITVATPPVLTGGTLPTGRWVVSGVTYYLSTAMTLAGAVDLTQSTISSMGQVWTEPTRIVADVSNNLGLVLGTAARFSRTIPLSFAGTFTTQTTPLALTPTCPMGSTQVPHTLDYQVMGNTLVVGVPGQNTAGTTITPRYTLTLAH